SLLHEKPFHDVTVKDIAARAAVHRATFYAHFDDKHAMVGDLFRERFAALLGDHLPKESSSPREFVRALVLAVLEHRRAAASACERTYRIFETAVAAELGAQLRAAVLDRLLPPGVHVGPVERRRAELSATALSWALYGVAMEGAGDGRTAEAFADEVTPQLAAMVSWPER